MTCRLCRQVFADPEQQRRHDCPAISRSGPAVLPESTLGEFGRYAGCLLLPLFLFLLHVLLLFGGTLGDDAGMLALIMVIDVSLLLYYVARRVMAGRFRFGLASLLALVILLPLVFNLIRAQEWYRYPVRELGRHSGANYLAYTPDGRRLVSGGEDGSFRVWAVSSGRLLLENVGADPIANGPIRLSPDGRLVARGGWSPRVSLYAADTGELLAELDLLPPAGRQPASLQQTVSADPLRPQSLVRGEWNEGAAIARWSNIAAVAFSPDGGRLFAGVHGEVAFWNLPVETGTAPERRGPFRDWVVRLAPLPGGEELLFVEERELAPNERWFQGRLAVSSGEESAPEFSRPPLFGPGLALSPDGRFLATWLAGARLLVWDRRSGCRQTAMMTAYYFGVWSGTCAFSPDSRRLAAASSWTLTTWRLSPGAAELSLEREAEMPGGQYSRVRAVAFSPDGEWCAVANPQGVFLWQPRPSSLPVIIAWTLLIGFFLGLVFLHGATLSPHRKTKISF